MPYSVKVKGTYGGSSGFPVFLADRYSTVQVEYEGTISETELVTLWPSAPGLFLQGPELAAALNEDGSLNGALNPAAPGSVIVLFGTGEGFTDPPGVDGKIAEAPLPKPVLPVEVTIGGEPAEVLYAGAAPGLVAGVFQINARISPNQLNLGQVRVKVKVGQLENRQQRAFVIVGR